MQHNEYYQKLSQKLSTERGSALRTAWTPAAARVPRPQSRPRAVPPSCRSPDLTTDPARPRTPSRHDASSRRVVTSGTSAPFPAALGLDRSHRTGLVSLRLARLQDPAFHRRTLELLRRSGLGCVLGIRARTHDSGASRSEGRAARQRPPTPSSAGCGCAGSPRPTALPAHRHGRRNLARELFRTACPRRPIPDGESPTGLRGSDLLRGARAPRAAVRGPRDRGREPAPEPASPSPRSHPIATS